MTDRRRAAARPALHAGDKLTFLLSLVPWLIERERASVAEAAEQFGMTQQQIRDAVTLLTVSGIPGDTAGYLPDDLFDIDWDAFEEGDEIVLTNLVALEDAPPKFSAREAAALIAGLQYLSSLPENADRDALSSLMAKLSRGASAAPTQVGVGTAIAGGDPSAGSLALIRDAITRGRQLEFDYLNARGERERRRVDPLRVDSADTDWYLRGWCHLREALRTFRLDRLSNPAVVEEAIGSHDDVAIPDLLFDPSPGDLQVTLELPESALVLLRDYLPEVIGPAGDAGDRIRATLTVSHHHMLKRLVTRTPGVVVVAPPAARRAVAEWAAAGAARYR